MSNDNEEKIARFARAWNIIAWSFRVLAILFGVMTVVAVIATGKPYLLVYLLFPPLWWMLTISWLASAADIAASRRLVLRLERVSYV